MWIDANIINALAAMLTAAGMFVTAIVSLLTWAQSRRNSKSIKAVHASTDGLAVNVNGKMDEMKRLYAQIADDRIALYQAAHREQTAQTALITEAVAEVAKTALTQGGKVNA